MNRAAMSWLKEWDTCVFKSSDAKNARKKAMAAERRKKARGDAAVAGEENAVSPFSVPSIPLLIFGWAAP